MRYSAGETVAVLRAEEDLIGGPNIRFRLACECDDFGLAVQAAALS